MSTYDLGGSKIFCRYLFSKSLTDLARAQGLKIAKMTRDDEYSEELVTFVCENAITGWDEVHDVDGNPLEFDHLFLYDVFTNHPDLFTGILRYISKIDNFDTVS